MNQPPYDGPIIDAHTHLWNLAADKYPWLRPSGNFGQPGRFDPLKGKNYGLEEYRRDIADSGVIASVHVEALWDSADGKINETRWLETLDKSDNLASRYVAGVGFGTPTTEDEIREHAAFPRVKGVRQTISWTPDPTRRMAPEPNLTRDPAWRAAIPLLVDLDLDLELLLSPYQAENVAELASDYPDLTIIVNHTGSPIQQDEPGLARWHDAILSMAAHPNVLVKLSATAAYLAEPSLDGMHPFVSHLVDSFGSERTMFGSDFPVGTLVGWSYADYVDAYRVCLQDRPLAEQEAIFWRTANRVYDFGLTS